MASYIPRATPLPVGRLIQANFTIRQVFEALLWELNKVSAPSIDVETFNYFFGVASDNYYKKRYNIYDSSQQTTDDLRELSATMVISPTSTPTLDIVKETFPLPADYLHTLSMSVFWTALTSFRAIRTNEVVDFMAERASSDQLVAIRRDHYNRPSYKKVYYLTRTDYVEIHAGNHAQLRLKQVEFNYLRLPEKVELKETDLDDLTNDPSAVLKQGATQTYEVLKELTKLILENQGNPRLNSKIPVDQAVPSQPPQQAQAAQPASRRRAADES